MTTDSKHVVIVGGSATGMAAALALVHSGQRVTILEREKLPACETSVEAFEQWERSGAPQTRHSHAFLARLHNDLRDKTPALYEKLLAAGAEIMPFHDMVREVYDDPEFIPEDDDIKLLACRRITFDWVLRGHLATLPEVDLRDGVTVEGLVAQTDAASGLPRVTGLRIRGDAGSETLATDLVVDASGRRTQLAQWLSEIGAEELSEESEECGIFYSSRFYRLLDGVEAPPIEGPIGADLGYMKYAIFPGDSGIFSVTLAASPEDKELRAVLRPEAFRAATESLPATSAWVDPAVSEPITKVYGYADLYNRRRFFVKDDKPLALGIFPIGDALVHQNPLSGRGCTLGWVAAWNLAEAWSEHAEDPNAFALALDAAIVRDVIPWYENMRDQDRMAKGTAQIQREGRDPYKIQTDDGKMDPGGYMRSMLRDGLMPALREDLVVLRAFMRVFNLLDDPRDLLADTDLLRRVMSVWMGREKREPMDLGPGRVEMVERLEKIA